MIKLTREREARMRELWPQIVTNEFIAREIGVSVVTLIKYGKILGLESRQKLKKTIIRARWQEINMQRRGTLPPTARMRRNVLISFTVDDMMCLYMEAAKRCTSPEHLCHKILHAVITDNLTNAVLDDAVA